MLYVAGVKEEVRDLIPAVTHIDNSARVQTVSADMSPLIYKLLSVYKDRTGIPAIINTSFNIRGKPIVETPHDALYCLFNSELDYVVLHNYLVWKNDGIPLHI
jgi:carbamoyltransferase